MRSLLSFASKLYMATKASDTLLGQVNAFRYAVESTPGGHPLG